MHYSNMKHMKKILLTLTAVFAVFALSSCATLKEVPEDLSAAQILQLGQNAYEDSDYKTAILCYETVIERYGTAAAVFVEAKYELAHVYLTQKKWDKAYQLYSEILALYDEAFSGDLPPAFKKLSKIGISQIPENKRPVNPSEAE